MPRQRTSAVAGGRARTAQAMVLLTAGALAQRWIPMRFWSSVLGEASEVPVGLSLTAQGQGEAGRRGPIERKVTQAVRNGSARLPWTSSCLAQVFAGQAMLRRRGAAGVAVIGLRRADGSWDAHAWLVGSTMTVTGGPAAAGFTALTVFAVPGGLQPTDVSVASAGPTG